MLFCCSCASVFVSSRWARRTQTSHTPCPAGDAAVAAGPAAFLQRMTPPLLLSSIPVKVAPLWYLAQVTFNASLSMTSVTSNTILSSTSALFTFLFAVALLAEAFTLYKLAFILLLIIGEGGAGRWVLLIRIFARCACLLAGCAGCLHAWAECCA